MCLGVAILESELPVDFVRKHRLERSLYARGNLREFRFLWRQSQPVLPVWHDGEWRLAQWGNRDSRLAYPQTGWTWKQSVADGKWSGWEPQSAWIPCQYALEGAVWYHVEQGIETLLLLPEGRQPLAYILCEPATRYYQVMTRSPRMPVLREQVV